MILKVQTKISQMKWNRRINKREEFNSNSQIKQEIINEREWKHNKYYCLYEEKQRMRTLMNQLKCLKQLKILIVKDNKIKTCLLDNETNFITEPNYYKINFMRRVKILYFH